ncbi:GTP pyrophosphokinase [Rhodococcoides kroppenstedtii]|uniref:GTP pyrophosphokinase n=1 Tax=Rhodococcoides kroppenstedtii TaxID=293050 RepID=UPI003641344A
MQKEPTMIDPVGNYRDRYDWFVRATAALATAVESIVADAGLDVDAVEARTKSVESAAGKFARLKPDGSLEFTDPLTEVTDLVGVRVITYLTSDIERVAEALSSRFELLKTIDKSSLAQETGVFGYAGKHLILTPGGDRVPPGCGDVVGLGFEVQIRTVLQHAWAEIEHDIRFKNSRTQGSPVIDRAFTLAAGLIELADQQFELADRHHKEKIAELRAADAARGMDLELTAEKLRSIVTDLLPEYASSRPTHYEWLLTLVTANGITTGAELEDALDPSRVPFVVGAMDYQHRPGHVRLVDDLLLDRFGEAHIVRTATLTTERDRLGKLRYRLTKLQAHQE